MRGEVVDGAVGGEDPAGTREWLKRVMRIAWLTGLCTRRSERCRRRTSNVECQRCSRDGDCAVSNLDEVLVERVGATIPSARGIDETTGVDINVGAHEAWPWLGRSRLGAKKVALGFLGELGVGLISSQIGQASPFEHQGAGGGQAVGARSVIAAVAEDEVVVRNAGRSLESVAHVVRQVHCLVQKRVDFA